jgi:hypothetical protein
MMHWQAETTKTQQVIGETKKAPLSRYDIINNIFMNERMAEALS